MSTTRRIGATTAAVLSGIALVWTTIWLGSHAWHWSNGAAAVTVILAVPALLLVSLSFRDPSTHRIINTALAILAVTAALYGILPRNIADG
jgi:hypothetical protein